MSDSASSNRVCDGCGRTIPDKGGELRCANATRGERCYWSPRGIPQYPNIEATR